jgi:hypothetical protein
VLVPRVVWLIAAGCAVFALGLPLGILLLLVPASSNASCGAGATGPGSTTVSGIPSNYLPLYEGAAQYFQLGLNGWAYLAALNYAESNFGVDDGPGTGVLSGSNYAGAAGPMQIGIGGAAGDGWDQYKSQIPANLPDGAQPPSVYNEADAVYVAAAMLHASGAPGDWAAALKAWNDYPPEWAQVYQLVAQYTHTPQSVLTGSGSGSPTAPNVCATSGSATPGSGSLVQALVPASVPISQVTWNRHDQGRDLEYPANTPILAMGDGYVLSVGNDSSGFGIAYPIVHFTTGPWAGLDIYFGHTRAVVQAGQSFKQGQIISYTGDGTGPYVGNATGIPGHVEIGLAPGGAPGPFSQPCPPGLQTAPPGIRLLAPASG